MIAIDTSVVIAIAFDEPERARFEDIIACSNRLLIGTPTLFELRMVAHAKLAPESCNMIDALIFMPPFEHVNFDDRHHRSALSAFQRYGKGRHPAGLNFGDCMSYAIAEVAECPLLFKGEDFAQTDIRSALA